jgi:hypothetical protein
MEDPEDNHHESHGFLHEAHPRQARQVPSHGPDDFPVAFASGGVWSPPLPAGHLTRSDKKLIGHWAHRKPAPYGDVSPLAEEVDPLPRAGVKAGYDCAAASPGASGMTAPFSDAVGSPTSAPTLSMAPPRISCARSRSSAIPR